MPGGSHHLIIRAADNTVLHDQAFALEDETLTPHDTALNHEDTQPQHADSVSTVSPFNLRVPFPGNAVKAEIVYSGTLLWSKTVSAHAPTINLLTPNGGTFSAGTPITVSWTATDLDGDPLDPDDATADADSDGLSNLDEFRLSTNPRSSDITGDGFSDNAGIDAGTDPLHPLSHPITTPILNVGSVSMGFTYNSYDPPPGPKSTWVTNLGGGTLNFSVTKDAAWLNFSPT